MANKISHDKPHARPKGLNPRVNGPYLDEVRDEQERAYRESRMKAELAKQRSAEDTVEVEPVEEETENADGE